MDLRNEKKDMNIVVNIKTGIEYIIMHRRGDHVILSRSCGLGYLNITLQELKENYKLKDGAKPKMVVLKESVEDITYHIKLIYEELEVLKSKKGDFDIIRKKEIELKDLTLRLNKKIKILLNQ